MKSYNWQLWANFESAAEELGFELVSQDGGCVYMQVPEEIRKKFYVMCWTPLNKLSSFVVRSENRQPLDTFKIKNLLNDLAQNHSDFHLEFGAKTTEDGGMYWFPELHYFSKTPSKDDIVRAVRMMLDTENFEKHRLMARLREEAE